MHEGRRPKCAVAGHARKWCISPGSSPGSMHRDPCARLRSALRIRLIRCRSSAPTAQSLWIIRCAKGFEAAATPDYKAFLIAGIVHMAGLRASSGLALPASDSDFRKPHGQEQPGKAVRRRQVRTRPATPPRTSKSSRAWSPSANAPACISAARTSAPITTCSPKCSTTPSTKPSPATPPRST